MKEGDITVVAYPFIRSTWGKFGEDEIGTWTPGVRFEPEPPDTTRAVADGVGKMVLTVVSTHKPGRYPVRIFYTRKWVDPEGKEFGSGKLHIANMEKFKRISSGYREEYEI